MKRFFLLIALTILFALSGLAQDQESEDPDHFIWLGSGVNAQAEDKVVGHFGYGRRVADRKYVIMNVTTTEGQSTLAVDYMQIVTRQDLVSLFILGELGIETGDNTTNLAIGGGMGVEVALDRVHPWLKNFGLVGTVKLLKDNQANIPNTVQPRYGAGLTYKFGK